MGGGGGGCGRGVELIIAVMKTAGLEISASRRQEAGGGGGTAAGGKVEEGKAGAELN